MALVNKINDFIIRWMIIINSFTALMNKINDFIIDSR